jgi:hypothetical protein
MGTLQFRFRQIVPTPSLGDRGLAVALALLTLPLGLCLQPDRAIRGEPRHRGIFSLPISCCRVAVQAAVNRGNTCTE